MKNRSLQIVGLILIVVGFVLLVTGYGQAKAFIVDEEGRQTKNPYTPGAPYQPVYPYNPPANPSNPNEPYTPSPEDNNTQPATPGEELPNQWAEWTVFGVTFNFLELMGVIFVLLGLALTMFW